MTQRHSGVIANTSSPSALRAGGPHTYTAAKAALLAVSRTVAAELWQYNVRLNSLVPGATWTRLHPDKREGRIPAAQAGGLGTDPTALTPEQMRLGRQMHAVEVAAAALYLASDDAGSYQVMRSWWIAARPTSDRAACRSSKDSTRIP